MPKESKRKLKQKDKTLKKKGELLKNTEFSKGNRGKAANNGVTTTLQDVGLAEEEEKKEKEEKTLEVFSN